MIIHNNPPTTNVVNAATYKFIANRTGSFQFPPSPLAVNFKQFFSDETTANLIYWFENMPEWLWWDVYNNTVTGVPEELANFTFQLWAIDPVDPEYYADFSFRVEVTN